MKSSIHLLAATVLAILPAAAHDHFGAAIHDLNGNGEPDAGEPLRLTWSDPVHPEARVYHLLPRPAGVGQNCGGYYMLQDVYVRTLFPLDEFSFTALSDGQAEEEGLDHPATGSEIWIEITSVTGQPGGNFGFWEPGRAPDEETPTISFPTNSPTGNFAFQVSEPVPGIDPAEQDPFGHIHRRAWTADKPGDYFVGFRFVDRSTTNQGGPWHLPSAVFVLHFKAGPDFQPKGEHVAGTGFVLTWPSQMGIRNPSQTGVVFSILRSTNPAANDWTPIGTVTGTTAATVSFTDASPPAGRAFYRLSYDWSIR